MTMRLSTVLLVLLAGTAHSGHWALDPSNAPVVVQRAVVAAEADARRGEIDEAIATLVACLQGGDDRAHPSLLYRLGLFRLQTGDSEGALAPLRRAGEIVDDSHEVWTEYARACYETGRYGDAAEAFERAHSSQGHGHVHGDGRIHHVDADASLLFYGATAWLRAERPERTIEVLGPMIEAVGDTVPVAWVQTLLVAATRVDRPAGAASAIERLLRDHPDRRSAWLLAGDQAQLSGDALTAARRLQIADWLAPLSTERVRQLGDLHAVAGIPRRAAMTYARLWPDDVSVGRALAIAWMRAHEPDSARTVLHDVLRVAPTVENWMLLGNLEFGARRFEAARAAYTSAHDAESTHGRARLMAATCSIELEDFTAARADLEDALRHDAVADDARRLLRFVEARSNRRSSTEGR